MSVCCFNEYKKEIYTILNLLNTMSNVTCDSRNNHLLNNVDLL